MLVVSSRRERELLIVLVFVPCFFLFKRGGIECYLCVIARILGLNDGGDFESFFRAGIRRVSMVFKIVMEETLRISE